MKGEFTAIIEPAPEGGFWAICPEILGANGQGETLEETKESLRQAIEMILDFDENDQVVGVEFLQVSERASSADLSVMQFEHS